MPNFSGWNLPAFSMHDLDPSRTPMWSFGHTKLGDSSGSVAGGVITNFATLVPNLQASLSNADFVVI